MWQKKTALVYFLWKALCTWLPTQSGVSTFPAHLTSWMTLFLVFCFIIPMAHWSSLHPRERGKGGLGNGQIPSAVKVSSISSWTLCVCLYIYLKQCSLYMDIYYITDSHTHTEYPLSRVIFTLASIRLVVVLSFPHVSLQFWSRFLSNIVLLWAHHVHFSHLLSALSSEN